MNEQEYYNLVKQAVAEKLNKEAVLGRIGKAVSDVVKTSIKGPHTTGKGGTIVQHTRWQNPRTEMDKLHEKLYPAAVAPYRRQAALKDAKAAKTRDLLG